MSLFSHVAGQFPSRRGTVDRDLPIVLARVDNRLVHGQVLSAWVPALDVNVLVVIDDEAARNTLVRSAMEIAIPPDVQFEVAPVQQAGEAMLRVGAGKRAMVLLRDVAEVGRALDAGLKITRLNLGNVHFSHGRVPVSQAVYLSADEVAELHRLEARGVTVELKTLPRDAPMPLAEIERRMNAGPT